MCFFAYRERMVCTASISSSDEELDGIRGHRPLYSALGPWLYVPLPSLLCLGRLCFDVDGCLPSPPPLSLPWTIACVHVLQGSNQNEADL